MVFSLKCFSLSQLWNTHFLKIWLLFFFFKLFQFMIDTHQMWPNCQKSKCVTLSKKLAKLDAPYVRQSPGPLVLKEVNGFSGDSCMFYKRAMKRIADHVADGKSLARLSCRCDAFVTCYTESFLESFLLLRTQTNGGPVLSWMCFGLLPSYALRFAFFL